MRTLLYMSVTGAVLILAIAVIRLPLLRTALPKATFRLLWGLATLRLLIPWEIPFPLSIYACVPQGSAVMFGKPSRLFDGMAAAGAEMPAGKVLLEPAAWFADLSLLGLVWLLGTAVMGAVFLAAYIRWRRIFRAALPVTSAAAGTWLASHPLRRAVRLRQSDRIAGPLTYGIFRPVILLPRAMAEEADTALSCVLTHEYIHIRRFDAAFKLALAAALCLHWWNPAVWLLYGLAGQDLELACDEAVLETREIRPGDYARALLSAEAARSGLHMFSNCFGGCFTERRIHYIMKRKPLAAGAVLLAALLVVLMGTIFATSAQAETPVERTIGEKLVDSMTVSDAQIAFVIPEDIDASDELTIRVFGRAVYSDGFSQSLHLLEGSSWKAGELYTVPLDPSYTELTMYLGWREGAGAQREQWVDLLALPRG